MEIGTVIPVDIEEEMKGAYLDYAMSVIVSRALPDVRDGLKPVQRRILYTMHEMGLSPDKPYRKSARIVGEVLGKFHPHGDAAVYEAMARMAQDFTMRYLLIDGQGNFGSIDGDPPAAMRYTEARLAPIAVEMLADIEKETVDFTDNFDGSLKEPTVLPAKLPNLLVNGSSGIAVGMATSIPPHNLQEVAQAIAFAVDNYHKFDEISLEDLMRFIKGPDFPTGGIVLGYEGLKAAYATGKGLITVRALTRIEEIKGGRYAIIVTQIPYQVNKSSLLERIAELVRTGRLEEIADLRDESDREGMSIVIELKRGADPRTILLKLFKYTPLQVTFGINMLALVNGEPVLLSLKELLRHYIEHRREIITRRTRYELEKARQRTHILEGLLIALANLDEVVNIIRGSRTSETALRKLMERFKLTQVQAQAILDMPLRRLVALERQKLQEEHKELSKAIKALEQLLKYPRKILELIKQEVLELAQKYGDPRRTQVLYREVEVLTEEDLVAREEFLISITARGFVHRVPFRSCRVSKAGKESLALEIVDGDSLALSLKAESVDQVLVIGDRGRLYSFKPYQVEGRFSLPLSEGESPAAALALPSKLSDGYLVIFTEQGRVKRLDLKDMPMRSSGLTVIKLEKGDRPIAISLAGDEDELFIVTASGLALRFPASEVRPMGRDAAGVSGIKLKEGDRVTGAGKIHPDGFLLLVTDKGYAKRVAFSLFPFQHRYGQGVVAHGGKPEKVGLVVAALALCPEDEFLAFSEKGKVWRMKAEEVPSKSRPAVPEAIIALGRGESVKGAGVAYGRLGSCSG
ncbi:MAG: DNA gyrase subunit A [Anaerolineae bacterium]|nr:DNA gyrase subunit A [Anaerolineae bacterium]MDW8101981.1 DNA gyrase subunit A [Anaerolineae bacterium]